MKTRNTFFNTMVASNGSASVEYNKNLTNVLLSRLQSVSVRCLRSNIGGIVYDWRATLYTSDNCAVSSSGDESYVFYGKATCSCPGYHSHTIYTNNNATFFAEIMRQIAIQIDCNPSEATDCDHDASVIDSSTASSSSRGRRRPGSRSSHRP